MRELWSRETRYVFGTGVLLSACVAGLVLLKLTTDPVQAGALGALIAAAILGGRIPAIVAGLEAGFSSIDTSLLLIIINTAWFCLTFPLFMVLHQQAADSAWLRRLQWQAKDRVRSVSALGSWGLGFFVWLPFPLTGALVGAAIGLLMALSVPRLMMVVLSSMWLGVVMWTFGFDAFMAMSGPVGKIVCYAAAIGCIVYSLIGGRKRRPTRQGS